MTTLEANQEFPFFVDVGNGRKMYTLRATYEKNYGCTTDISSCHIMSLSSDYENAVKKAKQYATDNNVRVVISENLPKTLNKITQRTPEEVAEEKRYIAKQKFMAKELSSLRMIKSSARNGLFNINKLRTKYVSSHVGQIDDRIDFDCTLEFTHNYVTYYGEGVLNSMKDTNGNVITYFGSRSLGEKGDKITFSAKIKKHDEYKGIKQTIIQRPTKIKNHTREW